jgi:RHS repeat-associated protein
MEMQRMHQSNAALTLRSWWEKPAANDECASGKLFPGQYYDEESGLHYNYYRDYDPGTGRYVESDPSGLSGGLNSYVYALNNALSYTDELGLNPVVSVAVDVLLEAGCQLIASNRQMKIEQQIESLNETKNNLLDRADSKLGKDFDNCRKINAYCKAVNVSKSDCDKLDCKKQWKDCTTAAYGKYDDLVTNINNNISSQVAALREQHWLLNYACPPALPNRRW